MIEAIDGIDHLPKESYKIMNKDFYSKFDLKKWHSIVTIYHKRL
jgi:hypothetical protein